MTVTVTELSHLPDNCFLAVHMNITPAVPHSGTASLGSLPNPLPTPTLWDQMSDGLLELSGPGIISL